MFMARFALHSINIFSDCTTHDDAKNSLRELGLFRLQKRRSRGNLTVFYSYLISSHGVCREGEDKLFLELQ